MVGCWRCTYPSIHFFRLKITVGCPRCCGVCCVCGVLCWCWCLVVVVLCVVWVVCFCVFVLFCFFFSILFFLFLALSLSFFLLSSFPLLSSLFSLLSSLPLPLLSSLLATKHCGKNRSTNTAANFEAFEGDLAHGRCTAVGSLPPSLSSLLPFSPSPPKKKDEGTFRYRNISGEGIIFHYSFILIQKNRRRVKLQALQLHINSKTIDLQRVKTVIIFGGMVVIFHIST